MSLPKLLSLALLATLSTSARPAQADYAAYTCQGPESGPVQVLKKGNFCSGFQVSTGDKTQTVNFDFKGSGKLIASKDGRSVVMIQSYLYGRVNDAGEVVAYDRKDTRNPAVIYVYRDGKKVATHRIGDIVLDLGSIRQSISHLRWLRSAPKTIDGKSFEIETTDSRRIHFDTTSGAIIKKKSKKKA